MGILRRWCLYCSRSRLATVIVKSWLRVRSSPGKGAVVKCASAIARGAREGEARESTAAAYCNLTELLAQWKEIPASEPLRRAAMRLLRTQNLRATDAIHLGAALVASDFEPHTVRFFSEDRMLTEAAEREGFLIE